jgi:hypothetical protein
MNTFYLPLKGPDQDTLIGSHTQIIGSGCQIADIDREIPIDPAHQSPIR